MTLGQKLEKRGEEKGEKIGREKRDVEIAKKMIKKDISLDIISEITELTKEELMKIKNEMNDK